MFKRRQKRASPPTLEVRGESASRLQDALWPPGAQPLPALVFLHTENVPPRVAELFGDPNFARLKASVRNTAIDLLTISPRLRRRMVCDAVKVLGQLAFLNQRVPDTLLAIVRGITRASVVHALECCRLSHVMEENSEPSEPSAPTPAPATVGDWLAQKAATEPYAMLLQQASWLAKEMMREPGLTFIASQFDNVLFLLIEVHRLASRDRNRQALLPSILETRSPQTVARLWLSYTTVQSGRRVNEKTWYLGRNPSPRSRLTEILAQQPARLTTLHSWSVHVANLIRANPLDAILRLQDSAWVQSGASENEVSAKRVSLADLAPLFAVPFLCLHDALARSLAAWFCKPATEPSVVTLELFDWAELQKAFPEKNEAWWCARHFFLSCCEHLVTRESLKGSIVASLADAAAARPLLKALFLSFHHLRAELMACEALAIPGLAERLFRQRYRRFVHAGERGESGAINLCRRMFGAFRFGPGQSLPWPSSRGAGLENCRPGNLVEGALMLERIPGIAANPYEQLTLAEKRAKPEHIAIDLQTFTYQLSGSAANIPQDDLARQLWKICAAAYAETLAAFWHLPIIDRPAGSGWRIEGTNTRGHRVNADFDLYRCTWTFRAK